MWSKKKWHAFFCNFISSLSSVRKKKHPFWGGDGVAHGFFLKKNHSCAPTLPLGDCSLSKFGAFVINWTTPRPKGIIFFVRGSNFLTTPQNLQNAFLLAFWDVGLQQKGGRCSKPHFQASRSADGKRKFFPN